ncbi:MAG: helix-turn-helix domain-containing protein [Oscillospiraceae bacterium]|nr:helix-turn-helix domain-containing protein [Oscillospiraceae bacterium]
MNSANNFRGYRELSDLPLVLCVYDVQAVLGVGRKTVDALIHSGQLKSIRARSRILIPKAALIEYLNSFVA